jgi:magnesium-transporting ATPase (P-type)
MDPNNSSDTPQTPAPTPVETPAPQPAAPAPQDTNKGLSIASLILAFFIAPVGLILGIVALVKSKKAQQKNGLALAAIIVSSIVMVLSVVVTVLLVTASVALYNDRLQECRDLIPVSNPTLVSDGGELKCSYSATE